MYLFLFGRDPELSKLELENVLMRDGYDFEKILEDERFAILDIEKKFPAEEYIKALGGTVRIANIYHASEKLDSEFAEKLDFYFPKNFNYAIEGFGLNSAELSTIEGLIKLTAKSYKSRGVLKKNDSEMVDPSKYFSWRLDEGFELFVIKRKGKYMFAQTLACTNSQDYKLKDEKRPIQKFTRGTSFRLAQMMVNCLGLEKGKTLVDPFCGIGTFLIEGMIAGYNVIGIDNEKEMTDASEKNVEWAKKRFNLKTDYKLVTEDSRKADFQADACVFEPYMGPFLSKAPNKEKALKIIKELENLYLGVFANLSKNLTKGAPIVCVLPYLKTYEGEEVRLSSKFFQAIAFKFANQVEYKTPDGSWIQREIYIS